MSIIINKYGDNLLWIVASGGRGERLTVISRDLILLSQLAFTCSKLITETLEQVVKYVQS